MHSAELVKKRRIRHLQEAYELFLQVGLASDKTNAGARESVDNGSGTNNTDKDVEDGGLQEGLAANELQFTHLHLVSRHFLQRRFLERECSHDHYIYTNSYT